MHGDDPNLLARVAEGDRAAFAELYQRYAGRICAFLTPALGRTAAVETMQEVMLRVWRHARRYDPARAAASTWIYTIARNARTDRYRRLGRPEPDPDDPMWVPSASADPFDAAAASQRAATVHRALATLPKPQREVLERSYLQGQTMVEIAEALGVPLGTVKSRSRLALQRLRDQLERRDERR